MAVQGGVALVAGGAALVPSVLSGADALAASTPTVVVKSLADPASFTQTIVANETLADAIDHLNAISGGGRIEFASGLSGRIDLHHFLPEITEPITIDGPGAARLMVDGEGLKPSILTINTLTDTATTISGLTLTDGYSAVHGGAIDADTPLVVDSSVIEDSRAKEQGGGIFSYSSLTLHNSTVRDNSTAGSTKSFDGGLAIWGESPATAVIDGSTISGNTSAQADGGLFTEIPTLIENSTIYGNRSADYGAGVGFDAGTLLTVRGSTISGNRETAKLPAGSTDPFEFEGGGIAQAAGPSSASASLSIYDSIVARNHDATGVAPDVAIDDESKYGAPRAEFSLIGNAGGSGIAQDSGHNDILGSAKRPVDPQLGKLARNGGPTETLLPQFSSPSVGTGDRQLFSANLPFSLRVDQRGRARRLGGSLSDGDGTDMGAVELAHQFRELTGEDRRIVILTVPGDARVSARKKLPVKFAVTDIATRHPLKNPLRFRSVTLSLSGSSTEHRYRRSTDAVSLSLRGLRRGRHRLDAEVTFDQGKRGHVHAVTAGLSFTIDVG